MNGQAVGNLTPLLSGRAAALGFANAPEAGASSILDRVRRGACLGCAVTVRKGEPFPPSVCGCGLPARRSAAAARYRGFVADRVLSGWCEIHAATVPKDRHRPIDCASCRAGLPDWSVLLAEANAGDFFERHPVGQPLPRVPLLGAPACGSPPEGREVAELDGEGLEVAQAAQPRGRALLDGRGAGGDGLAHVTCNGAGAVNPLSPARADDLAAITAEFRAIGRLLLLHGRRLSFAQASDLQARQEHLYLKLRAAPRRRPRRGAFA